MKTERNNSAHGSGSMGQHEPREEQHETEASVTAWLASVSPRFMDLRPLSLVALFGEIVELLGWGSLDDMGHCGWAQPSSGLSSQLPTVTSPIYAPAARVLSCSLHPGFPTDDLFPWSQKKTFQGLLSQQGEKKLIQPPMPATRYSLLPTRPCLLKVPQSKREAPAGNHMFKHTSLLRTLHARWRCTAASVRGLGSLRQAKRLSQETCSLSVLDSAPNHVDSYPKHSLFTRQLTEC